MSDMNSNTKQPNTDRDMANKVPTMPSNPLDGVPARVDQVPVGVGAWEHRRLEGVS